MLDLLAAAALNGTLVVALAAPPRLYKVAVTDAPPPAAPTLKIAPAKVDCSKLTLTFGGVTIDTSLPQQPLPSGKTLADRQTTDAVAATQLATGRHGPVALDSPDPNTCDVSFIGTYPSPTITATEPALTLTLRFLSATEVDVTAVQPILGYETVALVSSAPVGSATPTAATTPSPVHQDCSTIVLTYAGGTIDTSQSFQQARPGRAGLLFRSAPARSPSSSCVLVIATPSPVTAATATLSGVAVGVFLQPSAPLYGMAGGSSAYDLSGIQAP